MKSTLLTLFLITLFTGLNAQTPYVIQNNAGSSGGDDSGMGSSFLTSAAGKLDSIQVFLRTASHTTGTLYVYDGNTTNAGSQIYTQTVTGIPTGPPVDQAFMIKLTAPVALNASSTYTFMFHNAPIRYGNSNTYADGSLWAGAGFLTAGEYTDKDVDFIVYIGTPIPASVLDPNNKDISYTISGNTISLKNFEAEEILVYDLIGKTIASGKGEKLELGNLFSEGMYVLSVRKGTQIHTARIYLKP